MSIAFRSERGGRPDFFLVVFFFLAVIEFVLTIHYAGARLRARSQILGYLGKSLKGSRDAVDVVKQRPKVSA